MDLVWTSFQYFQRGISLLQCIIDTKILLSNFFFFYFLDCFVQQQPQCAMYMYSIFIFFKH